MSFVDKINNFLFPSFKWQITVKSITGAVRDHNEDCVIYSQNDSASIAILADGVGGHNAGEVASHFVCEGLKEWFEARPYTKTLEEARRQMQAAIVSIHNALYQQSQEQTEQAGMATTLAVVMQHKRQAIIAWAGDSRIYLERKGKLDQLSEDHSYVEEKLRQGLFSHEEAEHHPMGNIITSSIGGKEHLPQLGIETIKLKPDDRLLILSDGVSGVLASEHMLQLLPDGVEALIDAAQQAQSTDNCSAIIVKVTGE